MGGRAVLIIVLLYYTLISWLALRERGRDEIRGFETDLWHWKR